MLSIHLPLLNPIMTQVPDRQLPRHLHLRRHDHKRHVEPQQAYDEEERATRLFRLMSA